MSELSIQRTNSLAIARSTRCPVKGSGKSNRFEPDGIHCFVLPPPLPTLRSVNVVPMSQQRVVCAGGGGCYPRAVNLLLPLQMKKGHVCKNSRRFLWFGPEQSPPALGPEQSPPALGTFLKSSKRGFCASRYVGRVGHPPPVRFVLSAFWAGWLLLPLCFKGLATSRHPKRRTTNSSRVCLRIKQQPTSARFPFGFSLVNSPNRGIPQRIVIVPLPPFFAFSSCGFPIISCRIRSLPATTFVSRVLKPKQRIWRDTLNPEPSCPAVCSLFSFFWKGSPLSTNHKKSLQL